MIPRAMCRLVASAVLVLATTMGLPAKAQSAPDDVQLKQELTTITEQVLEAIRLGDKAALDRHLTREMVLINRDGVEYTRQNLLDELVPPREGYDLRFKMLESRMIRRGGTAWLTFLLDEYLTIFGHNVSTVYRNHFLFLREDGAWKLALYTYWEKPSTPPPVTLEQAAAEAITGTYELEPGKWVTHITYQGGKLQMQRQGGKAREFIPMAGERFYVPGVEAEYFFEKDAQGKVTSMVFRRNWVDLRFRKVAGAAAH